MKSFLLLRAAALAVVAVVVSATPAFAMSFNPDADLDPAQIDDLRCEGRLCLFDGADFGGKVGYYDNGSRDLARYGPAFDDRTTSIINGSGITWCVYADANYSGRWAEVPPHSFTKFVGADWDNMISSVTPGGGRRCDAGHR